MNQVAAFPSTGVYELALASRSGRLERQRRQAILWLTGVFWGLHTLALWTADLLDQHPHLLRATAVRLLLMAVGLALCFGIHVILQELGRRSWRQKAPIVFVASLVAAELFAWCTYFGLVYAKGEPIHVAIEGGVVIRTLVPWTWFFLAWVGLYLAVQYSFEARAEERRSAQLRTMAQSAKLQALHYQINPHFLFNSFNSVSALILDGRTEDANAMVERLASFFRVNLATNPDVDISLAEEIALQATYLEIEQTRYPDLSIRIDLPPALGRAAVPAFILQPLVENAVKHGAGTTGAGDAWIAISARHDEDRLKIMVENSCSPSALRPGVCGTHTGLRNVRDRLSNRFGVDAKLSTERLPAPCFRATIELPLGFVG
ncbi:sensor histidine kinase [Sphingopyxis sp. JAI108]|uniref:sensor histidine kinase n=1 Tax=Sphingopyxis sp. JAI108 TaxID=2723060 RepID=UPI0015C89AAA|nr:histidine kinase [Sphingopyxis sp. JAI108]NYF30743.1 FtsH-binding integral membrane protein [Sphingopyxis sp. JAI108]